MSPSEIMADVREEKFISVIVTEIARKNTTGADPHPTVKHY